MNLRQIRPRYRHGIFASWLEFRTVVLIGASALGAPLFSPAQSTLEIVGAAQLRALDPTLTGSVRVLQAEAPVGAVGNVDAFEVSPSVTGHAAGIFFYRSQDGSANAFANNVGAESWHANAVGSIFFGKVTSAWPEGVSPGVTAVDNWEAGFFYNSVIVPRTNAASAVVINQSFVMGAQNSGFDQAFDSYAGKFPGRVIVSGAGNGGGINSPATSFNCIAVAAYGGSSSAGPTTDGRCKPDITAPGTATSFSTPVVSGAAALLAQAAARNDGGTGTAADAGDSRTIKALLLNGAVRPADWVRVENEPLDRRYGAGVVNVYNSYRQLKGGKRARGNVSSLIGWNRDTITGQPQAIHHYFFTLSASTGATFDLTATLVWMRNLNETTIKNLDLQLVRTSTGLPVPGAISISTVDNVEHIKISDLLPGSYDLQVLKAASVLLAPDETYALAFEFAPRNPPGVVVSAGNPTGGTSSVSFTSPGGRAFQLQAKGDNLMDPLSPWSVVASGTTSTTGTTIVQDPAAAGVSKRFYRVVFP